MLPAYGSLLLPGTAQPLPPCPLPLRPHKPPLLHLHKPPPQVVVFTASLGKYADPLLDLLDKGGVVRWRLFRESCYPYEGSYVKVCEDGVGV